ncbi:MAG TPA: hypothetical protein VEC18_04300 [Myxococcota bacterium]|nr:hypothetical protein [Myxococcota bacterium]
MKRASRHRISLVIGVLASSWLACAGEPAGHRTVLAGATSNAGAAQAPAADPRSGAPAGDGPIELPYRDPPASGIAYRLVLEIEGESAARRSSGAPLPLLREQRKLEAHFRELPVEANDSGRDAFLVGLDALRYTVNQDNPKTQREIELADDRLRVKENGETSLDNRGNRSKGPHAPRELLDRIFGVINHDASGNPTRLSARGTPGAREFMQQIPLLGAIAYTMVALPTTPIHSGSRWTGIRIPTSRSGELGLALDVSYSLAGIETFEGVRCAMILIDAERSGSDVTGVTGHRFDWVQAKLHGTAWVELGRSRVRRVELSDEISARWTQPGGGPAAEHRIEHDSKLSLTLRDGAKKPEKWADGRPHFDSP